MALSTTGRNRGADGVLTGTSYISLHSANPGTTGASEITGGSPAYARKQATWAAASGGSKSLSAAVQFDVAASTSVSYFGIWDALTAGNFIGGEALRDDSGNPVTETFGGQGTYTLTTASVSIT